MKKKYYYLTAACLLVVGYLPLKQKTAKPKKNLEKFSLSCIQSNLPFSKENVFHPISLDEYRDVETALMQKYHFLGAGGQCFAFASEDGQYVLKLLKFHQWNIPFYASYPLPYFIKEKILRSLVLKRAKQDRDFNSYRIASNELKESTGLIFSHLNKTKNLCKTVQIFDKENKGYHLQLDDFVFILQKKVTLVEKQIDDFMHNNDIEKGKELVKNIVCAFVDRSLKGIIDDDAKIHRNFGCIGTKVVFIDIGRFRKDETIKDPKSFIADIKTNTNRFSTWLSNHYPELKKTLEEQIEDLEKIYL